MSESPEEKQNSTDNADDASALGVKQSLRKIGRARTRLLVCFWTLPVYVVVVWVLLNNGRDVDTVMWIYMALYAVFAVDMSRQRCPKCHNQFFVKTILLNLITKKCVHCEQSFRASQSSEED